MELHTLGVNGGYTQQDVTEVARVFTVPLADHRVLTCERLRDVRGGVAAANLKPTAVMASDDWQAPVVS